MLGPGMNRFLRDLGKLAAAALALVFPARCAGCGAMEAEDGLCARCAGEAWSRRPRCFRCGADLRGPGAWRDRDAGCRACAGRDLGVARTAVVGPYEATLRRLVRRLKYGGRTSLGRPLGALLAARVSEEGLAADVVVPVPLDARRERRRGFNQAELVARELARRAGLPLEPRALARVRPTPALYARSAQERWEAVAGAFAVLDAARIRGRRVLVVDDVLTSGATLAACAAALRAAGAAEVVAACVARRERRRMAAASA
jgi:ComF family protein